MGLTEDCYSKLGVSRNEFAEMVKQAIIDEKEAIKQAFNDSGVEKILQDASALYSLNEVAKILDVSRQTVSSWVKKNYVDSVRMGKYRLFDMKAVSKTIRERHFAYSPNSLIDDKVKAKSWDTLIKENKQK